MSSRVEESETEVAFQSWFPDSNFPCSTVEALLWELITSSVENSNDRATQLALSLLNFLGILMNGSWS